MAIFVGKINLNLVVESGTRKSQADSIEPSQFHGLFYGGLK